MTTDEFEQSLQAWAEETRRDDKNKIYELFLWPEVRRRFTRHSPPAQTYDVLIIPVSNLYTALLHIDHYRPAFVVFLFTEKSKRENGERLRAEADELDVAFDDNGGLINETDTLSVYQAVRQAYERYAGQRIAIDITGGTKAMSVGAAMAGAVLGLDTIYIESQFDKDIQDRRPGTEQPHRLPDPYQTFGDIQRRRAFDFYRRHDYVTAEELFAELARRVQPPEQDRAWAALAGAYACWDAFDLARTEDKLARILANDAYRAVLAPFEPHLKQHGEALRRVRGLVESQHPDKHDPKTWRGAGNFDAAKRQYRQFQKQQLTRTHVVPSLLAMLYGAALRREEQERLDNAALLLYRCLELMSQQRLAHYDGLTEYPRDLLDQLRRQTPDLEARYHAVLARFELDGTRFPDSKITLLNGYVLLYAIDDPFATRCDLAAIQEQTEARNQNILAHGFAFIEPKAYQLFRRTVDAIIGHWAAISRLNWEDYCRHCTFVQPDGV